MPMFLYGVPFEEYVDAKRREIFRSHPAIADAVAYLSRISEEIGPILFFALLCLLHTVSFDFLRNIEDEVVSANRLQSDDVALSWSASLLAPFDNTVASFQQLQSSTPAPSTCGADNGVFPFNATDIIGTLLPLVSAAAASKIRLFDVGTRGALRLQEQHYTNASSLVGWILDLSRTTKPIHGRFDVKSIV